MRSVGKPAASRPRQHHTSTRLHGALPTTGTIAQSLVHPSIVATCDKHPYSAQCIAQLAHNHVHHTVAQVHSPTGHVIRSVGKPAASRPRQYHTSSRLQVPLLQVGTACWFRLFSRSVRSTCKTAGSTWQVVSCRQDGCRLPLVVHADCWPTSSTSEAFGVVNFQSVAAT